MMAQQMTQDNLVFYLRDSVWLLVHDVDCEKRPSSVVCQTKIRACKC